MELNVIDTHAHLDMPEFDLDRDTVIGRAFENGVKIINTIGINLPSCYKAIELAEKYPGIVASVGFHPQESEGGNKADIDILDQLAQHPKVVAIGEMGLDYYRLKSSKEKQLQVLKWQLELAKRVNKPIIIHCREAQEDMLNIIQSWIGTDFTPQQKPRGVLHCFSGNLETAQEYIRMGFLIALGAYIGYPSSGKLRDTLKNIASDNLVVETDCPFLPPQKYRGQRNEPFYSTITLGILAEIQGLSLEEMGRKTTSNARRLFNLVINNKN